MTLIKTKKEIRISRRDWEKLKRNPAFSEAVELLEDMNDLEEARNTKGKDLTLDQYLQKRGIQSTH